MPTRLSASWLIGPATIPVVMAQSERPVNCCSTAKAYSNRHWQTTGTNGKKQHEPEVNVKYIYRYWILVPLLLLAVLSRNWVEDADPTPDEATIDMTRSKADYYLESFETRKFNTEGQPEYVIEGHTLSHFPENDSSVIEKPRLVVFRKQSVWHMQSLKGVFTPQPDTFLLEGDVSMRRNSEQQEIRLETSEVTVLTEANQVRTDQPVTVSAENWQLRSIGLESDIEEGTLNLLSNVTARYETN